MLGGWSSTIDPIQLADRGARLSGELPIKGMARLVEMCRDDGGSVNVDLEFARAPGDGLRVMHGTVRANVNLTCQRCMGGMTYALASDPRLVLLKPGERSDLIESGDAVVIERPVALGALIEDELLLEMPMVPMHPIDDCPAKEAFRGSGHDDSGPRGNANPFSALAALKRPKR